MSFGEQKLGSSREDFGNNEDMVVQKKQAIAEAAAAGDFDKVAELAQEAKGLKGDRNEMMGNAEDEADDMDKDFNENRAAEAKAAEETAKAEQAMQDEAKHAEDAARAAALAEQIKSGSVGVEAQPAEAAQEKPTEEQLEAPKTEMFEKYGEKMRGAAAELVSVKKKMWANEKIMSSKELDMAARLKAQDENKVLNESRNKLRGDVMSGVDFRRQKTDETYNEYSTYLHKAMNEYGSTVMQDPQTVMSMLESGELGGGYRENEGIGQINEKLRGNPEFMAKALELLPNNRAAENFWIHCTGEAKKNRELYIAAVKKNHLNYQWGAKDWKLDPEVQKVALESGLDPTYLQK